MPTFSDVFLQVGADFSGVDSDMRKYGDQAGRKFGLAVGAAAAKSAEPGIKQLGAAIAKARSAEADATGRLRIAQTKLDEVRSKSKVSTSQLVAAEEALAKAQRGLASSQDVTRGATNALARAQAGAADALETTGKKAGGRFSRAFSRGTDARKSGVSIGKQLAVGLGGALAFTQGLNIFKGFVADAAESAKIARITANAIRTTGAAANVTADQVSSLATALSNKTAIDDETIQSGANLLLTFRNVRNEAGKGNDIFNQATAAAADLSVQFGSVDGASKMLGKALNDPIKGMSALSRAGVTFTEQQKEQVKTLVKSGDVLGAQKIILKEIQQQVGGAAAAASDPMARLRVIAGNLGEDLGTKLLPMVERAAEWLGENLPKALDALEDVFKRVQPTLKKFGDFLSDKVVPALKDTAKFVEENKDFFIPFTAAILGIVAALRTWAAIQAVVNFLLAANPLGLVVLALAALVGGIVYAYKNSETFRKLVDKLWDSLKKGAKASSEAFGKFKDFMREAMRRVVDVFLGMVDAVITGAAKAFGWIPGIGTKLRNARDEFKKFRAGVNQELAGIKDQSVTIMAITGTSKKFRSVHDIVGGRAQGGAIHGPGTGTSDTAGLFRLSNGEHVLTAREVNAMGGHAAVEQFRRSLPGLAQGGPADFRMRTRGLDPSLLATEAKAFVSQVRGDFVAQLRKQLASAPVGPGGYAFPLPRGSYRVGMPLNGYPGHTGQDFPAPTGTRVFSPFSGYFSPVRLGNRSYGNYANVTAGGMRFIGAHLNGFARGAGLVRAGELIGYVGSTGNSTGPHLHAEFRRNGSVVNPRSVLKYDRGGYLPQGTSVVHNGTGGPERVLDRRQTEDYDRSDGQVMLLVLDDGTQLRGYVRRQAAGVIGDTTRALAAGRRA